ncbi:nucleoside 2-deoxyribosyltransferase [Streptomyces alboflavus]|uniref:nucleoside 2-deoxyribosyltransferase n=1 Tax=Streptomyces alboflavus TaxID=67267 RepID=UPI0004BFF8F8|nr:nucleoside 2-deoxyribosyltransferase [Streptomyces alboflavus]
MYYVAHRLFAAHDRALAARLAQRVAEKTGPENVFLPFCDTNEEDLIADVKGQRLFELDRERLGKLTAMIAILHGPSLDDGVCMEIGYACALGVPVVVVTTDFQTYSMSAGGPRLEFPDPIVQAAATSVVRVARLADQQSADAAKTRLEAFVDRNEGQLDWALEAAVENLLDLPARRPATASPRDGAGKVAFVEPSPYLAWQGVLTALASAAGYVLCAPGRFEAPDPVVAAHQDLNDALTADVLIADVSGPETPPGAALLIGAASACGTRIAAYQPRLTFTHAHGREPNWRNLMIQYASSAHLSDPAALDEWLRS